MLENITFKELIFDDINNNLLDNFNRYQKVDNYYKKENKKWVLKSDEYINFLSKNKWDKNRNNEVINEFIETIKEGGYVFGAYDNKKLIGFAILLNKKFGSKKQYIQLSFMQVSFGYRNKGIGKKLFELCIEKAKEIGVQKIYISTNPSEETQKFYLNIGCKDAMEINKKLAEDEPYDRQMEYEI
jgi:N-acetylglutamate synthase-like GNAT family acetyltransferase